MSGVLFFAMVLAACATAELEAAAIFRPARALVAGFGTVLILLASLVITA